MQVCSFPNEEGSNYYYVPLQTLASTKPTLAVLAFQALVPYVSSKNPNDNPSSVYCTQQLGGTVAANTPTEYLPIPTRTVGLWQKTSGKWGGGADMWGGVGLACASLGRAQRRRGAVSRGEGAHPLQQG